MPLKKMDTDITVSDLESLRNRFQLVGMFLLCVFFLYLLSFTLYTQMRQREIERRTSKPLSRRNSRTTTEFVRFVWQIRNFVLVFLIRKRKPKCLVLTIQIPKWRTWQDSFIVFSAELLFQQGYWAGKCSLRKKKSCTLEWACLVQEQDTTQKNKSQRHLPCTAFFSICSWMLVLRLAC